MCAMMLKLRMFFISVVQNVILFKKYNSNYK
jgi:hypothetical protein